MNVLRTEFINDTTYDYFRKFIFLLIEDNIVIKTANYGILKNNTNGSTEILI
jgi:hypothetical protein